MKKIIFKEDENNTVIIVGTAFEAETLYKEALASGEASPLVIKPMPKFNPAKMYGIMFYDVEGFDFPQFKVVTANGIVRMLDDSAEITEYTPSWSASMIHLKNEHTGDEGFFKSLEDAISSCIFWIPKDTEEAKEIDAIKTPEQLAEFLNRHGENEKWSAENN